MANPFPGMDPYLEGPFWTVVHVNLADEIARQLVPQVGDKYLVHNQEQVVLAPAASGGAAKRRFPDVGVFEDDPSGSTPSGHVVAAPLILRAAVAVPTPRRTVEIRSVDDQRLVTAIEVMSPSNKRGPGQREYAKKRQQLLRQRVHLLEIDLLRGGKRYPLMDPLPRAEYYVFLSRAGRRSRVEVWPIPMASPLPKVPVPLLRGDPDVAIDLQAILTAVHGFFRYDRTMKYQMPPAVPFTRKQAKWADRVLRAAGKRP